MFKSVLWLASWYPSKLDPFDGDFIERHAIAVSRFTNLTVIFVVKDETLKNNAVEIEKTAVQNLTVYKVYYGRSGWGGMLEQLFSLRKYMLLQRKIYRQVAADKGPPSIVHVQVAMKAGMLARWLKKKYQIPFVVSEHWTGYYPHSVPNIYNTNTLFKLLIKKILKDATLFLPVSDGLGKIINQHFMPVPYRVVPNTVNTEFFYYEPAALKKFRFIHPSYMSYQKNPEGILEACKLVKENGYEFELLMIGNKEERLVSLSQKYGVDEQVLFEAVVPYPEVASRMRQSSALLLFSRFENLPCVLLEALCCGLPVISSRVGGIPEVINTTNGILVESEDTNALAAAMIQMMDSYYTYNREALASEASALFSYEKVGKQFAVIYNDILDQVPATMLIDH
ncbi:MAG: glycosyltransferase [Ferruginibacter sp.]